MAQQMNPVSQMPPQRPYSPYPPSASPTMPSAGGVPLPPAKRPRLSPNPPSPYTNSPYSPVVPQISTSVSIAPPLPFNQPQPWQATTQDNAPRQAPGTMGPPQRPADKVEKAEKATDLNELSDLVTASGIDLREEENLLADSYRNYHTSTQSFNSQTSSTVSPNNSFNVWSQGSSGGFSSMPTAGVLSQQTPVSQKSVEEELIAKHKLATRARNDDAQQHLNSPFLHMVPLRQRMASRALEVGVKINLDRLYDRIPEAPPVVQGKMMISDDGTGIVDARPKSIISPDAPLVEILALLSLAAEQRLRDLVEDAFKLTRGRQIGTHGLVPPEWSSIATGPSNPMSTTAVPTSLTGTVWDAPDGAVNPLAVMSLKRKHSTSDIRLPTPPTDTPPSPQPTISFCNPYVQVLKALAETDRAFEEKRREARERRRREKAKESDGTASPAPGLIALEQPLAQPKLTKKERERLAKANMSDEHLHKAANATASLALGGSRKYNWLTSGGSGSRSGTSTPRGGASGGPRAVSSTEADVGPKERNRTWGMGYREDSDRGRGIQTRDIVTSLELDGKEKKTLVKLLTKLANTQWPNIKSEGL